MKKNTTKKIEWLIPFICLIFPIFYLQIVQYENMFMRPIFAITAMTSLILFLTTSLIDEFNRSKFKFLDIKNKLLYLFFTILGISFFVFFIYYYFYSLERFIKYFINPSPVIKFQSVVYKQDAPAPTFLIYSKLKFQNNPDIEYEFWYPKLLRVTGEKYEVTILPNSNIILDVKNIK